MIGSRGKQKKSTTVFPEGDSPADQMERLGLRLTDMAEEVKRMAASLKEDQDERRRLWLESVEPEDAAGH